MWQLTIIGLCKGGVYALVALGFGLVYSTTRIMHIAHAGVFVSATYALYAALLLLNVPLWLAVVLGGGVAISLGLLIELIVYWPLSLRAAPRNVLLISSLGVQIILVNLITLLFGNSPKFFLNNPEPVWHIGSAIITRIQIAQLVVALFGIAILALFLWKSNLGQTIRALADDPELAIVIGVPVRKARLAILSLGSLLAYSGGCLMALDVGMEPYSGFPIMLTSAVACIVGGLHHLLAPALGAFLLGLIQSLVIWKTSSHWGETVTFGILLVFLLLRPEGILGAVKRVDE